MAKDKTRNWKAFLLFLAHAFQITLSSADCLNFGGNAGVDLTKGPSDTRAVFSFTRMKPGTYLSEVWFLEDDFKKLLQCFSRHVEDLNSCGLDARYTPYSGGVRRYRAQNVTYTTATNNIDVTEDKYIRSYTCTLPEHFADSHTSRNRIFCEELQIESNCFKDTDLCISFSPATRNSAQDRINIMWGSGASITYRYNSNVVEVSPCNFFTTTIVPTTLPNEITTETRNQTPIMVSNSGVSDEGTDNIGLIIGAVCGSLLLIALIIIGILCWKRPVVIWKRGRKLSTDPTSTGVSTSNVSQPSANSVIYTDEEIYPSPEAKHHTKSSISTSDYASIDSENLDTLEAPMRKKGSIKDVYASVHQSRKRAKKPKNSNSQTDQNSENSDNPKGKRHSIKDVYALIHKSRKRAKEKQQTETNNNNADQTPQIIHGVPSSVDETYTTNDVQNGDQKKPNKYSGLHEVNVNIINPYDDLIEPNEYQDAASAEAIDLQDLSNEDKTENQPTKEAGTKLKTKPVIPSKPKFLAKSGN